MRFRKIPETAQRNISGLRLREARLACDPPVTQEQLSARLAELGLVLDRVTIAKIETGQRCVFDYELKNFVLVFGKPSEWFLGLDEASSKGKKGAGRKPRQ